MPIEVIQLQSSCCVASSSLSAKTMVIFEGISFASRTIMEEGQPSGADRNGLDTYRNVCMCGYPSARTTEHEGRKSVEAQKKTYCSQCPSCLVTSFCSRDSAS